MKNQNSLLRTVLEENPVRKKPLGRPKLKWEDRVKKDVEQLGGGSNWNRDGWRIGCKTGCTSGRINPEKKIYYTLPDLNDILIVPTLINHKQVQKYS